MSRRSSFPRTDLLLPLVTSVALFVASWCVLALAHVYERWYVADRGGDMNFYYDWGTRVAAHQLPYRDFSLEYPPGVLLAVTPPPYLRKLVGYHLFYATWFKLEILVVGLLIIAATAWTLHTLRASRRRAWVALGFAGIAPLALGPIALSRYDYFPALCTAVAVAALVAKRYRLACAVIGIGAVVKVYPLLLLPIALAELWRTRRARGALEGLAACVGVIVAAYAYFLVRAPAGVWHGTWRQISRPLQVESLGASFMLAAHQLAGLHVHAVNSHGSDNFATTGARVLGAFSTVAVVVGLLAVWIWFARSEGGAERAVVACAAAVAVYVAFNKVYSPQYLIWLFPLVPLVRGRRGLHATALLLVITLLTQAWEPWRYNELYVQLRARETWLLVARDLLTVALAVILVRPLALERHAEKLDPVRAPVV